MKETVDTVVLLGCALPCALSCVLVAMVLASEGVMERPLFAKVSAWHLSIGNLIFNVAATVYFLVW